MKKSNLIFIVGGLGLLYYFLMRKKYPNGLSENDYVKSIVYDEIYVLKNGTKRPITRNYWLTYFGDNYENVKIVDQALLIDIPNGAILDI